MKADRVIFCALLTTVIPLGFVACEHQQMTSKPRQTRDRFREVVEESLSTNLTQVSESLAIIDAENRVQKDVQCSLVQIDGSSTSADRRRALCQAYSKATEEMTTIVRDALASKKRPTDAYTFYLWNAPDDLHECDSSLLSSVNDCELPVGLFSRLETCQQVEAAVRGSGEGTRQCRNWNIEKFYQSDRHQ